ncbi:MAG: XdhC family protein [Hyphomonadaceae bacterium]
MDTGTSVPSAAALMGAAQEHPLDVLSFALAQGQSGTPCALVMIIGTEGGAVRREGAIMVVTETGARCGYLSGGCIDADIALHAQHAIATNTPKQLRYGKGSPFVDIRLPCGGGIDLAIIPQPDIPSMSAAATRLMARQAVTLDLASLLSSAPNSIPADFSAQYHPKLKLRIAGIGADPVALIKLASSTGLEAALWSQDEDCRANAANVSGTIPIPLTVPDTLPEANDDTHTAFILMAHDPDWETPLLKQALAGPAFYIGAVGSPNTHKKRCETLKSQGVSEHDIARIHGPVGLVPSMRDASMLAVSCMAEIIACFHKGPAA